jgi:TRAP-type mannitol/chloroaromatic compound transport system permease large subunit
MNRRTFDVLVPLLYVMAILTMVFFGTETALGAVAALGALAVAAYYAALRQNLKS